MTILDKLQKPIIGTALESGVITSGVFAEQMINERREAAQEIIHLNKLHEEFNMYLTVGNGLRVWGHVHAIRRVQDFFLLDSKHPQEKEDVRRSLARDLQAAEERILELETLLKIRQYSPDI